MTNGRLQRQSDAALAGRWLALFGLLAGTSAQAASATDLSRAARRLGSAEFAARNQAGDVLLKAGASAIPYLREAAESEIPEIRFRATDLLHRIELQVLDSQKADILSRIRTTSNLDDLATCSLIVEAATENFDIKKQIFEKLDSIASSDAILSSNTSSISITKIAAVTKRPTLALRRSRVFTTSARWFRGVGQWHDHCSMSASCSCDRCVPPGWAVPPPPRSTSERSSFWSSTGRRFRWPRSSPRLQARWCASR